MKEYWRRVNKEALRLAISQAVASLVSFIVILFSIVGAFWGLTVFGSPDAARDEMVMRASVGLVSLISVFLTYLHWVIGIPPKWDADAKAEAKKLRDRMSELEGTLDRRATMNDGLERLAGYLETSKALLNQVCRSDAEVQRLCDDEDAWRQQTKACIAEVLSPAGARAWDVVHLNTMSVDGSFNPRHDNRRGFITIRGGKLEKLINKYAAHNNA